MVKRKSAKELLGESIRELAESRPVDKITIQEIGDNCGYSSATFYRHFRDKYDLIAWEYAQGTARIMDRIDHKEYVWEQTLMDGVLRFQKEKNYLKNLFLHTSGHDSFVRYMTEINQKALTKHILSVNGLECIDQITKMYIRIYCLGTVNLTCDWILGKYDAAPEELAEVFLNSLPQPLHPYLMKE